MVVHWSVNSPVNQKVPHLISCLVRIFSDQPALGSNQSQKTGPWSFFRKTKAVRTGVGIPTSDAYSGLEM